MKDYVERLLDLYNVYLSPGRPISESLSGLSIITNVSRSADDGSSMRSIWLTCENVIGLRRVGVRAAVNPRVSGEPTVRRLDDDRRYHCADRGRRYGKNSRRTTWRNERTRRFKNEWRGRPTASTHILYPRRSDVTGAFLISQEAQHL